MKTFHSEYNDFMQIEEVIGKNLKYYRAEAEVTQQRVADVCGVSSQQIRDIEAGRKKPSIDLLVRIASALKIDSSKLLEYGEPVVIARPLPFKSVLGMYSKIPEALVKEMSKFSEKSDLWSKIEDTINLQKRIDDLAKSRQAKDSSDS